jgi:tetratricopeptide (TPR) repeat protein
MSGRPSELHLGLAHHQAGRLQQAHHLYQQVLSRHPRQADALHLTGLIAHQQGRHIEAIAQIRAAIETDKSKSEYFNNLGAALRSAGQEVQAVQAFNHALRLAPRSQLAWSNLVGMLSNMGQPDAVLRALNAWVLSNPQSTSALSERAAHRTEQSDLGGAIHDYQRIAELTPDQEAPLLRAAILAHQAGDDSAALSMLSQARSRYAQTAGLDQATTHSKLSHDIEQIEWLVQQAHVPADWIQTAEAYRAVRDRLCPAPEGAQHTTPLDPEAHNTIGHLYNRPIHLQPCPARAQGALSPSFDGAGTQHRYAMSKPGVTWADGLLTEGALADLRRYCMGSTIWTDFRYSGGYVGAALANGVASGLLLQIARELRARMPQLLGPHPLRQLWAYKYDSTLTGIGPHADEAAVNVNFWITPDSANLDPQTGGLVVWRKTAPLHWRFEDYNRHPDKLMDWVRASGAQEQVVPYRCNRAVIFDSNLVHRTADLHFKPGYENRRINITMLFGTRG